MSGEIDEIIRGKIGKLKPYLSQYSKKELEDFFAYGEKMKAEGERKKQEFRENHNRDDFMKLLEYKRKYKEKIKNKYEPLSWIEGLEKERYIEEYLYDDMLYSGKIEEEGEKKEGKKYSYEDWKNGRVVMEEGVTLNLSKNRIGAEGAKIIAENLKLKEGVSLDLTGNEIGDEGVDAISHMKLQEGVILRLRSNKIGTEGARSIAENLKLKEGVVLNLYFNQIGDEGAEAIAKNLELKEGVFLNLSDNQIGDKGAETLMKDLHLKNGVLLKLLSNNFSDETKEKLKKWEKSYHDKGIKCSVLVN